MINDHGCEKNYIETLQYTKRTQPKGLFELQVCFYDRLTSKCSISGVCHSTCIHPKIENREGCQTSLYMKFFWETQAHLKSLFQVSNLSLGTFIIYENFYKPSLFKHCFSTPKETFSDFFFEIQVPFIILQVGQAMIFSKFDFLKGLIMQGNQFQSLSNI